MPHQLTAKQQYWSEIIESVESSGLSIADYARENQLAAKELCRWRSQLKNISTQTKVTNAQFIQVVATRYSSAPTLSIQIAQAQLQFNKLPNPEWLARLLAQQGQPV